MGKTLCELAGCASQYQPPEGPEYQSGCPDENFLKQHIRIHELNFTDLRKYSMEELFDFNFINNSENKGSSSYVQYDEESFKEINS